MIIASKSAFRCNIIHVICVCKYINTAAGVHKFTKIVKNVKIVEFHYHIWNHHEKCIQISTNMPGIGLVIREIVIET